MSSWFSGWGRGKKKTVNPAVDTNDDQKDDTVRLNNWSTDTSNNTQIQFLTAHSGVVRALCKIDKNRFASASDDCLILIWSTRSGLLLDVLQGHNDSVKTLIVIKHHSHRLLISASSDHSMKIWDVTNDITNKASCITTLTMNASITNMIIYKNYYRKDHSKHGKKRKSYNGLITTSSDGQIAIWAYNESFKFDDNTSEQMRGVHFADDIEGVNAQSESIDDADDDCKVNPKSVGNTNNTQVLTSLQEDFDNISKENNYFKLDRIININSENNMLRKSPQRLTSSASSSSLQNMNSRDDSTSSRSNTNASATNNASSSCSSPVVTSSLANDMMNVEMTQMLLIAKDNAEQLVIGCKNGSLIFINFARNDRIKMINKHHTAIKYIYQLSIDRFISCSYDGLICVWRIESAGPPQLLERINDETQISSYNLSGNNSKLKEEATVKDLKLNCFLDFKDICGNQYFIVSFGGSIVIFDIKFLVKAIVRNAYNDCTEIVAMTMIKDNNILITANCKHCVKLWNIEKLNLKSVVPVWLSSFRQDLMNFNGNNKKSKKNKNQSRAVDDLCADSNHLLIDTFCFHSGKITDIQHLNEFTFVSCDQMNQVILWKDGYKVSHQQNERIKKYFNMQNTMH